MNNRIRPADSDIPSRGELDQALTEVRARIGPARCGFDSTVSLSALQAITPSAGLAVEVALV